MAVLLWQQLWWSRPTMMMMVGKKAGPERRRCQPRHGNPLLFTLTVGRSALMWRGANHASADRRRDGRLQQTLMKGSPTRLDGREEKTLRWRQQIRL